MPDITPDERRNCHDAALRCFGTAYIFEQRAKPLALAQKLVAFSSLAGPISIGILVTTVGLTSRLIPLAIGVAATFSALQTIVSLWSLAAKWPDSLAYYVESKAENYHLAERFTSLGRDTALAQNKWRTEYAMLETRGEHRTNLDLRINITDEEKRMAMRAALREYERPCAGCQETPTSLHAGECHVCGNFKKRWLKWLV